MKPFLLSSNDEERKRWSGDVKTLAQSVAIYNRLPIKEPSLFDRVFKLDTLYKDRDFFDALAKVTDDTDLFLWDLGLDYCRSQSAYIKEYTKLKPLSQQAGRVWIVDHLAFYYSEYAIYRPFLYLKETVFHETLQQFYGQGAFADYEGNKVEAYAARVSPFIECLQSELDIQVLDLSPTLMQKQEYEKLKRDIILTKKLPRASVVTRLFKFINAMPQKSELAANEAGLVIQDNNPRLRHATYQAIVEHGGPVTFINSGFGIDNISLRDTLGALHRHNDLVRLLA